MDKEETDFYFSGKDRACQDAGRNPVRSEAGCVPSSLNTTGVGMCMVFKTKDTLVTKTKTLEFGILSNTQLVVNHWAIWLDILSG